VAYPTCLRTVHQNGKIVLRTMHQAAHKSNNSKSPESDIGSASEPEPEGCWRLYRSLTYIKFGVFFLYLHIFLSFLSLAIIPFFRFIYLLPLCLYLFGLFTLPSNLFHLKEWQFCCSRLKLLAIYLILISPFWYWWQCIYESYYLFVNSLLFFILLSLSTFLLASMIKSYSKGNSLFFLQQLGSFTRLSIFYLMFSPLFAYSFVILIYHTNYTGYDFYSYTVTHLSVWSKSIILFIPIVGLFLLITCFQHHIRKNYLKTSH
jgi:hypothetical protein